MSFQLAILRTFGNLSTWYEKFAKEQLKIKLYPTWKIHILVLHLKLFLDHKKAGLGIYCEQTTEAAHAIIKPTPTIQEEG